jgi:C4-dicarboxylate-binding protein DctP
MNSKNIITKLFLIAFSMITQASFAQKIYVNVNAGYNFNSAPVSSRNSMSNGSSSTTYDRVDISLGKGTNIDAAFGYLLLNDVQIIAPSLSKFDRYTNKIQVFDLPFLFKDADAALKFENSKEGKALLKSMEDKGLIGLNYWGNGMRHFSANKDFRLPSDVKGLKFRIQASDVYESIMKSLGANGQKMAFAEVYQALQTGVVDGQENSFSNTYSQKFHEVQKTIIESNHGILDYMVVVNAKWWNGLPADVKKGLSEAMAEATVFNNQIAKQKNDEARAAIEAAGKAKIVKLTDAQLAEWKKAMQPVYKQFEADIGADLIKAAQAASKPAQPKAEKAPVKK